MKRSYITLGRRNLTRRKSRTLLTLTGVVLSIGFTVGLLSISEGFIRSFDKIMGSQGPEIFLVPAGQKKVPFPMAFMCSGKSMDEDVAARVRGVRGVSSAEPAMAMLASKEGKGLLMGDMPQMIFGVPPETYFEIRKSARIAKGRRLRKSDSRHAIVGHVMAANLEVVPGDTINVAGDELEIVGVLKKSEEPYDYFAYMPLKTAQELREMEGKVCAVFVKLDSPRVAGDVKTSIQSMFGKKLEVQTAQEMVAKAKSMLTMTQAVHFGVSCFALIIGVLFVACTMIMSVSERIREFATLRVIGASRGYVTKMIISEALTMSVIGGLLGCVLGYLLSKMVDKLIFIFVGETFLRTFVSPKIFLIAFVISVLIGTFSGLLPARMILKKELAESLRYE